MLRPDVQSVLVTGATGFIGRRLVRRLVELHHPVFCLVRPQSCTDVLSEVGAQLITGDVTDASSVQRALAGSRAGIVFHVAGVVRTIAGISDDFMGVNADGVATVAAACADRADVPVLVVVSSLAAAGPCDANEWRMESDAAAPVSNYGRSKLAGEQAAMTYAGTVPITLVRPPIVFGPADRGIFSMFELINNWGLHFVPAGSCERGDRLSLVHVDDVVRGLLLAAEKGERLPSENSTAAPGSGIYFLAGDAPLTWMQLGEALATALDRKAPTVIRLPGSLMRCAGLIGDGVARVRRRPTWISSDKVREGLAGSWACSSDKARSHLGWSPEADLAVRLHETAQWYRDEHWL